MSQDSTRPSAAPTGGGCAHCDDSVPHEHLDVRAIVEASRAGETARARTMTVLAAAVTLVATGLAWWLGGAGPALGAVAVAATGWVLVTVCALAVLGAARSRAGDARALVVASLTQAGLTPLVALAVAVLTGATWPVALVAGGTWLLCGALAEVVRARSWGRMLFAPGEAGEHARARAVADRGRGRGPGLAWPVQGAAVAAATWLLGPVPLAVVVLVPLAVALAAARRPATPR